MRREPAFLLGSLLGFFFVACGQTDGKKISVRQSDQEMIPTDSSQPQNRPGDSTAQEGGASAPNSSTNTTANIPIPAGPTTAALIAAAGPLSFDLGTAKPMLAGSTLSLSVTVNPAAGSTPASLAFSNIVIKTPVATGMVIYRPVLVLTDGDRETQFPIGTNINQKIPKNRSVPLGGVTTANFSGIAAGASLKLRFSALEPLADALLDGIPNYRECRSSQTFKAVSDSIQACKSCHSGLFTYDFMDKDMATACGQNLKIIDKTLSSNGVIPTIPTGTHHGVNAGAAASAIGAWKSAEGL